MPDWTIDRRCVALGIGAVDGDAVRLEGLAEPAARILQDLVDIACFGEA
jgi:hypothetical protein